MTTTSSRASQHQADQAALVALLLGELRGLWPLLIGGSPLLGATVAALIRPYAAASAALAAEFYDDTRRVAGGRTRFTVPIAEPPPVEQVEASISWATRGLRSGRGTDAAALTMAEGVAQKLTVDTGRRTLVRAVTGDAAAVGWARVPTGATTCAFCALLCTRGAVYKSSATAGQSADRRFVGEGEFKFHDNDDCTLEPIFAGQVYRPSEQVERWERLYEESTADVFGAEKRRAFRRAFETQQ
ncbi:MAG TPA: hypothetical protein VM287_04720 [Egibacteraceae bacterium]|nr:hypothetical protein [Egibacteraceae bacterium]